MKINKELSKKFQTTFEAVAPTYFLSEFKQIRNLQLVKQLKLIHKPF